MKISNIVAALLCVALTGMLLALNCCCAPEAELCTPPSVDWGGIKTFEVLETAEMAELKDTGSIPLSAAQKQALFDACGEHGIDPALALGLIQAESNFQADAVSSSGCYGLCQLSPLYFPSGLSPEENIRYGMAYLAENLYYYGGDMSAALTAYHRGHDDGSRDYAGVVLRYAEEWRDKL